MKKDTNDIAAIEKAISKKYGDEAIVNPKSLWDEDKEKDYIEQVKKTTKNTRKSLRLAIKSN